MSHKALPRCQVHSGRFVQLACALAPVVECLEISRYPFPNLDWLCYDSPHLPNDYLPPVDPNGRGDLA